MRYWLLTFLFFCWSSSLTASILPTLSTCERAALHTKVSTLQEAESIEIELQVSNQVLKNLTTTDGTVAVLFPERALPRSLAKELSVLTGLANADHILWDDLAAYPETQRRILYERWRSVRLEDWQKDRKIAHLKIRSLMKLQFPKKRKLLGVSFTPFEEQSIELSPFIQDDVEWMGPFEQDAEMGVELHVHGVNMTSSKTLRFGWVVQEGLGGASDLHQHQPFAIHQTQAKANPKAFVLRVMMLFNHLNMLAEMQYIEQGLPLRDQLGGTAGLANFQVMSLEKRHVLLISLLRYYYGDTVDLTFKSFVGFAYPGFYKNPILAGIQHRTLSLTRDAKHHSQVVRKTKLRLLQPELGYSTVFVDHLLKFADSWAPLILPNLENILYGRTSDSQFARDLSQLIAAEIALGPQHATRINLSELQPQQAERMDLNDIFEKLSKVYHEIYYPFGLWQYNPLVTSAKSFDPEKLSHAHTAAVNKIIALINQLDDGFDLYSPVIAREINLIVRTFLEDSGVKRALHETFFVSFDVFTEQEAEYMQVVAGSNGGHGS